uniref:Uncharacterized protein n=1 Tax=Anguilla anguilla TaxID=7936 RepID=A0A0E9PYZ5_ANGAN
MSSYMVIYDQYSEFLGIPGHVREPKLDGGLKKHALICWSTQ